jgi:hypothetical protein
MSDGRSIKHPTPEQCEGALDMDDLPPPPLTLVETKEGIEVWRVAL